LRIENLKDKKDKKNKEDNGKQQKTTYIDSINL